MQSWSGAQYSKNVAMAKGKILSGPEPERTEPKTATQLNDERQPSALQESQNINNRYNETDERPAIEQTFQHNEVKTSKHAGKDFAIDADFEAAMQAATARQAEIAAKLQEAQTLDPEEVKRRNVEQARAKNLQKLYPDPIPQQDEVEDALWQKRTDKGAQIAGRAKLEDVYDSELHHNIIKSFMFQAFGIALVALPTFAGSSLTKVISFFLYLGSAIGFIYSFIILKQASAKYRNKDFPSDQAQAFQLATIAPFLALRLVIIKILTIPLSFTPFVGPAVAVAAGILIGSSLHYSFLYRYHIDPNHEILLINTVAFLALVVVPDIILTFNNTSDANAYLGFYGWTLETLVFFICDRAAAKTAPGHYS